MTNKSKQLDVIAIGIAALSLVVSIVALVHNRSNHNEAMQRTADLQQQDQEFTAELQQQEQDFTMRLEQIREEKERPVLEVQNEEIRFQPGLLEPILVPVHNKGKQHALITRLEFRIEHLVPFTELGWRPTSAGPIDPIVIAMVPKDYNQKRHLLTVEFRRPVAVPGGEHVVFQVAVYWPTDERKVYYVGELRLFTSDGEMIALNNIPLPKIPHQPPRVEDERQSVR